jgi:uncharacterized membrane-anchored protein YitT (DUF2179 family)
MGMPTLNVKKLVLDFIFLSSGCIILAFGITAILRPNGLITGGTPGIAILISGLTGINYTIIFYAATLIILVGTFALLGSVEGFKIILLSIVFPAVLVFFEFLHFEFIESDLFLASIYYGVFAGIGVGLIFKRGFSLGGTDTLAKIVRRKALPFMSISQILLVIDVLVILSSLLIYERNIALYGIVALFIFMKTVDIILFGFGSKKVKIEAISDRSDEISHFIMHTIMRGTSIYNIRGGYTNETRSKVVSICSPRESMLIRRYIARTDPKAFVYVIPIASVWGTGAGFYRLEGED